METGTYRARDGKNYAYVRLRLDGKYRKIRYDEAGRPFRTVKKAEQFGSYLRQQEQHGNVPLFDRSADVVHTVGDFSWFWFNNRFGDKDDRTRTPSSRRWTEGMIRCHIADSSIGTIKLTELRQSQVERWVAERSKFGGGTLSNSTLKMAVGLLRAIYAAALSDRLVDHSPVPPNKKIHWPRDDETAPYEKSYVPLDVDQVHALADAFPDRYRAMPLVQAGLGLRIGELLALREEDIHEQPCSRWGEGGAHVHIDWQFNDTEKQRGAGPGGRSRPKSRHSIRAVPLPVPVTEVLREHMATYPPGVDGSLFTSEAGRRAHASGRPIGHMYYGQQLFKRAMRAAGLPECTTHDLRHHYATLLLAAGMTHEEVAKRLGHADAGLVISTYGHAMPGGADDVRDAIADAWSKTAGARRHLRAV